MMQLIRDHARSSSNVNNIEEERVGPFVIKEVIGNGSTGTVKLAVNTWNGMKCAVKIVNKTVTRKRKEARKEIKILSSFQHQNVISLQHVEEDCEYLYIFTEYCELGDLYAYIEKNGVFEENTAKKLFVQLLDALEFCHRKMGICHHDVKLENCVLTSDFRVKLIDFGFAVELSPPDLAANNNNKGAATGVPAAAKNAIRLFDSSPAYSPLEVLLRRPHDESVDIFGLGTCLYYMLCGSFPFCDPDKATLEELCQNIRTNNIEYPEGLLSADVQDLLKRMLTAKKKDRITIDLIRAHSWLNSCTTYI